MAISIWAVMKETVLNGLDGKPYVNRTTKQVEFAGDWSLTAALTHAKVKHPEAIYFTIGSTDGAGCVAGDLSAGQ